MPTTKAKTETVTPEIELEFLKRILPDIISKGAIAHLREQPWQAKTGLSWEAMSNVELEAERDEAASFEKLRRSMAGLQAYNQGVSKDKMLYPEAKLLEAVSGADSAHTARWLREPYVASELSFYGEFLAPGVNPEAWLTHNQGIINHEKSGYRKLIQWPAAYGASAW